MSSISSQQDNVDLGRRLFAVRSRLQMAQPAFAASIGLSPRAYQNYERGERELPAVALRSLYLNHQVSPVWLLTGEEDHSIDGSLDGAKLQSILEAVESRLQIMKRVLPPGKKAKLVSLLYTHLSDRTSTDPTFFDSVLGLVA